MIYGKYKHFFHNAGVFRDVTVYPLNEKDVIAEYADGICHQVTIETVLKNYYPVLDYTSFFEAL